jgi:hypothetical protein
MLAGRFVTVPAHLTPPGTALAQLAELTLDSGERLPFYRRGLTNTSISVDDTVQLYEWHGSAHSAGGQGFR